MVFRIRIHDMREVIFVVSLPKKGARVRNCGRAGNESGAHPRRGINN